MNTASAVLARGPEWIGAAPHHDARRERPRLASLDEFHRPPAGFEHARPGTVLRSRDVDLAFLGLVPQRLRAVQLLYRTTDFEGRPEANVTTVVVPAERSSTRPMPLLSYQCAIDAVSARCFPSYAMRRGARALGALAQLELLLVAGCLAEGWAVAIPDHEGPEGRWGTPRDPGYRVLDGLRAALSAERLGLSKDAPIGMWGYSGGGLSTAWAAEVHAEYAPELTIAGVALGSPVGDLRHTFTRLNGSFFSALPALVVSALTHAYPGLDAVMERHVTPEGRTLLDSLNRMTTGLAVLRMRGRAMDDYIDLPLHEMLALDEVREVLDDISLGTAAPRTPVLIVQAVHDRVIAVEDIDKLAATYSAGGSDVTYHRDLLSEHMLLHPMSAPMTFRWLTDRFEGRPLTDNLVRTMWPTLLNPVTYRGMSRLALVALRVLTGRGISRRPL